MATTVTTVTLSDAVVEAIGWVGKIVTLDDAQYTVHSVEGGTFYAYRSTAQSTTVDASMTTVDWLTDNDPTLMIIPMGHQGGEGFGRYASLKELRRGVSLVKTWV